MSAKIFGKNDNLAFLDVGKAKPISAIMTRRPSVFKATVLPPAFGPEITIKR